MHPSFELSRLASWLWLLTALFAFRVLAQLTQLFAPVPFLPPFAAWHSATLSYGQLLAAQIVMLALMIHVAWRCATVRGTRCARTGGLLLWLGGVYFGVMLLRLLLGMTMLSGHHWFGQPIPAVFHLVLAGFVLTLGAWHRSAGSER